MINNPTFGYWEDDTAVFILVAIIIDEAYNFEHFYKAFRYMMSYEDVEFSS